MRGPVVEVPGVQESGVQVLAVIWVCFGWLLTT